MDSESFGIGQPVRLLPVF